MEISFFCSQLPWELAYASYAAYAVYLRIWSACFKVKLPTFNIICICIYAAWQQRYIKTG